MAVFIRQLDKTIDKIDNGLDIVHQMKIIQDKHKVLVNLIIDFVNERDQYRFHAGFQVGQRVEGGTGAISKVQPPPFSMIFTCGLVGSSRSSASRASQQKGRS